MTTRTFLITGASKGIGLALSERLSKQGHTVVGIARQVKNVQFPGKLVALDLDNDEETSSILANLVQRYRFDGLKRSLLRLNFFFRTTLTSSPGKLSSLMVEHQLASQSDVAPRDIPHGLLRNSGSTTNHHLLVFSPSGFEE